MSAAPPTVPPQVETALRRKLTTLGYPGASTFAIAGACCGRACATAAPVSASLRSSTGLKRALFVSYTPGALWGRADKAGVVAVVTFLEDRKVRFLPVGDRAALRTNNDAWDAAFTEYLRAQDSLVTADVAAGNGAVDTSSLAFRAAALCWLVDTAIACDYDDNGAGVTRVAPSGFMQCYAAPGCTAAM